MSQVNDLVTGIVYTNNSQRTLIPAGVDGSLGDSLVVSGLIYSSADASRSPIGTCDLSSVTTSVKGDRELRSVSIELSFNRRYARRSWISDLKGPLSTNRQPAEINLTGVGTYPLGGGLPNRTIALGVATGTGPFRGIDGSVSIAYERSSESVAYAFTLL